MNANDNPLVSVIFPVYGVEKVVEKSLQSVLEQTYENIEILVIDDCSPDNSVPIIRQMMTFPEYSGRNVRIIRHEHNQGLSGARNTGVNEATGKYVFFMDSDDSISPDTIKLHVETAERHSATLTDGNINTIGHHQMFRNYDNTTRFSGTKNVLSSYFTTFHISAWNKLILRSFLLKNKISFVQGILYEDMIWCLDVLSKAPDYVTLPEITYNYIIRSNSITQSFTREKSLHRLESYKRVLLYIRTRIRDFNDGPQQRLADRWLIKTTVKIKNNILNLNLTVDEKKAFFNWISTEIPPNRDLGMFSMFNRMNLTAFNLCLHLPYKALTTIYKKFKRR